MSINLTTGPRASRKQQKFLEESKMELEEQKRVQNRPEEQTFKNRGNRCDAIELLSRNDSEMGEEREAITFWTQQKHRLCRGESRQRPMFARVCSFTNDIKDGRFYHSDTT